MFALLDRFLLIQPRWLPTLLVIPILYGLGWITAICMSPLGLSYENISLTGTVFSFLFFLLLMPRWISRRWHQTTSPWRSLGIRQSQHTQFPRDIVFFIRGLSLSFTLLAFIAIPLTLGGWIQWSENITNTQTINAIILCFGVGIPEELIFRGWLWGELKLLLGARFAIIGQASAFSLVHTRFNLGLIPMLSLLIGLFLLGWLLAKYRSMDDGSLWGCIGLHGGLISGWFLIQASLTQQISPAPSWLVGPGGFNANPIGGWIAIITIGALIIQAYSTKINSEKKGFQQ